MTKTNSCQRAKARVKELQDQLELSESNKERLKEIINVLESDIKRINAKVEQAHIDGQQSVLQGEYVEAILRRNELLQKDLDSTFKEAAEVLTESATLKEQLDKRIKANKVFILLSINLVAIIIVLIATR